jgi:hypothetical protein
VEIKGLPNGEAMMSPPTVHGDPGTDNPLRRKPVNIALAQLQALQANQLAQAASLWEMLGNTGLAANHYRQAAAAWSACAAEMGAQVPDAITAALAFCQARAALLDACQNVNEVIDAVNVGQQLVQGLGNLFGGGWSS